MTNICRHKELQYAATEAEKSIRISDAAANTERIEQEPSRIAAETW
jgi:hypothetical protein